MLLNIGIYGNLVHWSNLLNHSARDELLQNATNLAHLKTSINNTVTAIDKASKIVFALKTYARHEQQAQKTQADIISGIETVLVLYQNLFKQGVEIIRDYQENLPSIWC
jgi:predicted nucleotide-binding protein